jgi:hypothetical protein
MTITLDRRDFVKLGAVAGAGLVIGIRLPIRGEDGHPAAPLKTGCKKQFAHVV